MRSHKLIALIAVCCLLGGTSAMAQDEEAEGRGGTGDQIHAAVLGLANGLANLVVDVLDIVNVGITYGSEPGYALEAGLTDLAGAGCAKYTGNGIGLYGRDGFTSEIEQDYAALRILTIGPGDHPYGTHSAGVGIHLGFVGVGFGTDLNSLIDAVSQVVFIDFEGDNVDYF